MESASSPNDAGRCDAQLVRAFQLLGKRWSGIVLATLAGGPRGFAELTRAVPRISESVLSDRLGELTLAQLVSRTVHPGPPLSVAYELTPAGRALAPVLDQLARWAEENLKEAGTGAPSEVSSSRP